MARQYEMDETAMAYALGKVIMDRTSCVTQIPEQEIRELIKSSKELARYRGLHCMLASHCNSGFGRGYFARTERDSIRKVLEEMDLLPDQEETRATAPRIPGRESDSVPMCYIFPPEQVSDDEKARETVYNREPEAEPGDPQSVEFPPVIYTKEKRDELQPT